MATFIPEWHRASGSDLKVRSVLNALDEEYLVRRPLQPTGCPAGLFVQHRVKGWLAMAVLPASFAELEPAQLFESEQRTQFEQRLEQLKGLQRSAPGLKALVVMWACATEEVNVLARHYDGGSNTRLVSREQFSSLAARVVDELSSPLPIESEQYLLGTYFPEAEIPAACTTRRFFFRDNSATLQRFFLDPAQEWASKLDLEPTEQQRELAGDFSVRLINGVAGSGKTLIAIHRALLLARLFPRQRTLLLIHNTPVVADLTDRLHRVHGGLPQNTEIMTFFAWARLQWRQAFNAHPRMPEDRESVSKLVRHLRLRWPDLKLGEEQLLAELDFINDMLISDEAGYLAASRVGRRFALREAERSHVWALYDAATQSLSTAGLRLWSALPREICLAEERHSALHRYDHILVDEAQFFAPSWLQLAKLSLAESGQLFLCADPNQGFLRNRLSWKSVGLGVAGRTKKLRRSYRTTQAILKAASAVLAVLGSGDAEDYLQPLYDGMELGTRPVLLYADTPQDALDRLGNELSALVDKAGISPAALLVIYGENTIKTALYKKLLGGGDNVWWLNKDDQKKKPPQGHDREYLRMVNVDTATGLEAGIVLLIGMESLFFRESVAGRASDDQLERLEANARKLYMAMTRAGQRLFVVSSQRLPAEMEALFDKA